MGKSETCRVVSIHPFAFPTSDILSHGIHVMQNEMDVMHVVYYNLNVHGILKSEMAKMTICAIFHLFLS